MDVMSRFRMYGKMVLVQSRDNILIVCPKANEFYHAMLHFCMPHDQPSPFSPILPLSQQLLVGAPKPNTGGVKISSNALLCLATKIDDEQ